MWTIALSIGLLAVSPMSSPASAPADTSAHYESPEALRHYLAGRWLELSGSTAEALGEYNRALSLDPNSVGVLLRLAEASSNAGQPAAALDYAKRALALQPEDPRALWLEGAALFNLQRAPEALEPLQRACDRDTAKVEYLRTLAHVAETQDRVDLVASTHSRILALDDEDGESWFQLSTALTRLGRFHEADSALAEAMDLNPVRPGAIFLGGFIQENLGHADSAIALYRRHLTVHAGDMATRRRLVTLLASTNHIGDALAEAHRVARAEPQDPEALRVEADLAYAAGQPQVGARTLERLRALRPDDPELVAASALVLFRHDRAREAIPVAAAWSRAHAEDWRGPFLDARVRALAAQYDSAAASTRRAIALAPDSLVLHSFLVRVLMSGRRYREAITELEQQHVARPSDWQLLLDLGEARELSGDVEGAEAAARQALAIAPGTARVQNFTGYLLADHAHSLEEARALIEKAVAQDPGNGAYVDSYGWVLYRQGHLEEARAQLEHALALTGGDSTILEHLGDVWRDLKRPEKAREQYRRCLEADGTNQRVKQKLETLR